MHAKQRSTLKWGIHGLNVVVLVVLYFSMVRDLPVVAANFFFLLFVPISFAFGVALAYVFQQNRKQSGLDLSTSLTMLVLAVTLWIGLFPPDLRPTMTVTIPADYSGNIYYFRPDGGEAQLNVDAYGCLYIPPSISEGKRFEIFYGDHQLLEEQFTGNAAMYTAELGKGDQHVRISFASFHIGMEDGVVRIKPAQKPLEEIERLHAVGRLKL